MVPLLCFRQPVQMLPQGLAVFEGGAVDSLQHGAGFTTPPIGSRHREQLEGGNPARGSHVRPLAQVGEGVVGVGGQHLVVGNLVDEFQLIGLVVTELLHLIPSMFVEDEGQVPGNGLLHYARYPIQVLRREGTRHLQIIVKPVLGRGADTQLGLGE